MWLPQSNPAATDNMARSTLEIPSAILKLHIDAGDLPIEPVLPGVGQLVVFGGSTSHQTLDPQRILATLAPEVLENLDLKGVISVVGMTVVKQSDFGTLFGMAYCHSVVVVVTATFAPIPFAHITVFLQ